MDETTWKIDLAQTVESPLYGDVIDWLKVTSQGRNVVFDFWARGSYTRRLIHQRQSRIEPLTVLVSSADELRWAYRRLMLLGIPIDFIYSGKLHPPEKLVWAGRHKGRWDGGWGYIGTIWKAGRHYNAMLTGTARLMPESLVDWVVEEAADEFKAGDVFVAPAELIGINTRQPMHDLELLSAVSNGTSVIPNFETGKALLELNLPFIDRMSNRAYRKFIADHEADLVRFRHAFRKLLSKEDPKEKFSDYMEELQFEIAELTQSDKYHKARASIAKLGGVLGLLSASVTVAAKTDPGSLLPVLGAAGVGAATAGLIDLYKQSIEQKAAMAKSPYSILWKLGLSKPSLVKRVSKAEAITIPKLGLDKIEPPLTHHWLCPPTPGVLWAGVKKQP